MTKERSNLILLKATMLLSTLPFLMATSPLPPKEPSKTRYDDISIEISYLGIAEEYSGYTRHQYQLDVKNIGEECAFYYLQQESGTKPIFYFDIKQSDSIFYSEMLKPSEHMIVKIGWKDEISDWSIYHFYSEKLSTIDEDVTFTGIYLDKTNTSREDIFTYELKGKISNINNHYYYGYLLDVSYSGKNYVVYMNPEYGLQTKIELDLNQLTINDVKAYRSTYQKSNETGLNVFYHFMQYGIFYLLGIFVVLPIIIIGVFFSC